jgi:hypothetical protein
MCRYFFSPYAARCSESKNQIAHTISDAFSFCNEQPRKCPIYKMYESSLLNKTVQTFQGIRNEISLKEVNHG